MDDLLRIQCVERGWRGAVPYDVGIALVLENRNVELPRQPQQLVPPLETEDASSRILHGRDGVDVLRLCPLLLELGENPRQCLHIEPSGIDGCADYGRAEAACLAESTLKGELLHD